MQVRIMFFNSPHMYVLENTNKPFGLRHTSNSPVALGPIYHVDCRDIPGLYDIMDISECMEG